LGTRERPGIGTDGSVWTEPAAHSGLSQLVTRVRGHWLVAFLSVLLCVSVAGVLCLVLPSYWRVEIVAMPVVHETGSNAMLGGFGGIAALLARQSSNQDEAVAVLGSRELFDTYARQADLLPILFSNRWDPTNKRWDVPDWRIPTLREGYKLFDNHIRDIDLDRRTGIVTMAITWKDRALAAKWARDLIDLANRQLRDRAIREAQQNMRYLATQMRSGEGADANNALNAALASAYERQLQNFMFAKGQPEFAFRVIDPPTIPDDRERVFPQRILVLILGLMAGCVLAAPAVMLRERMATRRRVKSMPLPAMAGAK